MSAAVMTIIGILFKSVDELSSEQCYEMHVCAYACVHVACVYIRMCACGMCVHTRVCMWHVCTYACVHVTCLYIRVCACDMCVHVRVCR